MDTIKVLTPKDIQCIFGIGKNQAYALMKSDGFPAFRLNNRLFTTSRELTAWMESYRGKKYIF